MLLGVFGAPLFISTFPRGGRLAPRVGLGLEDGMGGQTRPDGLLEGRRGLATGQHPCSSVTVTEPFKLGSFAPPSPPREQVAEKLICQDSGTLCDPGFGDVGEGPARGTSIDSGGCSFPSSRLIFFCSGGGLSFHYL